MAPLYSRYVPPKAAKPQEDFRPEQAADSTPKHEEAEEPSSGRKKRKRTEADESDRKAPKHAKSKTRHAEKSEGSTTPVVKETKSKKTKAGGEKAAKLSKKENREEKEGKGEEADVQMGGEEADVQMGGEEDAVSPDEGQQTEDGVLPAKHTGVFSKFQKAAERSARIQATAGTADEEKDEEPQPELHDIVPLPQPQREATPDYIPTFSALPDWLANPIVVSQSTTKPFSDLSLSAKTISQLESKGWTSAFAVQSALLPLLLPHPYLTHLPPNDICVSAPTGSGKTLGYVLPIVEGLRTRTETKLRAVIVVPTRELVQQAQDVATACAAGTGLRVATAVGNHNLAVEQESLIKKGRRYDPEGYRKLMAKAKRRIRHEDDSDDDLNEDTAATAARNATLADVVKMLPDHVPTYTSAVDILICTPGRLVEHMNSTVGFNLESVEWLVIDEADRLLDQSFQEWVAKVVGALEVTKPDPRKELIGRALGFAFQPRKDRYVRKIILSATMTRDITKLSALRLRRPSLIQVKGGTDDDEDVENVRSTVVGGAEVYELPRTLIEFAVPVGDGLDKPLFLLQLLRTRVLSTSKITSKSKKLAKGVASDDDSSDSESSDSDASSDSDSESSSDSSSDDSSDGESDSESDSDSDSSSSDSNSSDSDSDSDSDSNSESESGSDSDSSIASSSTVTSSKAVSTATTSPTPTVLIFTGSTEEAARLHHLLTALEPSYAPITTLLTKTTQTTSTTSSLLHSSNSSKPSIIISTDRASRGLDLPHLTHVLNYHMPRTLATYVHRVGRTARAGRSGEAWTLFQEKEGRWFWRDVVRGLGKEGGKISRVGEVERMNMKLEGEFVEDGAGRKKYEDVLSGMKEIVSQGQGKHGKKERKGEDVKMSG